MTKTQIANDLHHYMKFRASQEGVGYTLSPGFFRKMLNQGCGIFFGVTVSEDGLVEDEQNPGAFAAYCARVH